ncbi:MAG: hypothetical protein ONB06_02210 [candidate division KSB1 bacterium]|nr:hypothetical protein [candidate division KSB1 bacterium]
MSTKVSDKEMMKILKSATKELCKSAEKFRKTRDSVFPPAPIPKNKIIVLSRRPLIVWPHSTFEFARGEKRSYFFEEDDELKRIIKDLGNDYGKVMFFANQLRAAARWLERRAEGMRRHSNEIKEQQGKSLREIKCEVMLYKLKTL